MKTLQIASANMEFFNEQVRILREKNVDCDVIFATSQSTNSHIDHSSLSDYIYNNVYGHNIVYYIARSATFYPIVLSKSFLNNYDIIHTNSGMIAPFGALQPRRPLVTTFWGDDVLGNRLKGYSSKISKHISKISDASIVRSEEMAAALPTNAYIIPSGVDMDKFRPISRDSALEISGWDPESKHILFPYQQSQSKKRYNLAQKIVDELDEELEKNIELQTLHGIQHNKMYYYYNSSDVLLLPSLREGSPNTVKEAMACNLPVVSTNVGDVQTRLQPVQNSFVAEKDSDLKTHTKSVILSNKRSDGRKYAHDVSLDSMGDQIISIYKKLL